MAQTNINKNENIAKIISQGQDIRVLQRHLNDQGYPCGATDGIMGRKTAAGIANYLQDNPELLSTIDDELLLNTIKYEQRRAIETIADTPAGKEALNQRIQAKLEELGGADDPRNLYQTSDYQGLRELQTLLTAAGHKVGGVDGFFGSKTLRAVREFNKEQTGPQQNNAPTAPKAPAEPDNTPQTPLKLGQSTGINTEFTQNYDGDNGYGVSNLAIERAWSKITGQQIPSEYSTLSADTISSNRPLIVIDLGHGSDIGSNNKIDPGAVSKHETNLSEITVVDPVSEELAKNLHAQGYAVAFTRNPNEQLRVEGSHSKTLTVRPDFSHQLAHETNSNGVLFISIHANAATNAHAKGSRIYYDVDKGQVENSNSRDMAASLTQAFSIAANPSSLKRSADLSVIDRFENGIKNENQLNAGVLVELGFLTNKGDAQKLAHMRDNPEQAGKDLATGINNYVMGQQAKLNNDQTASAETNHNLGAPGVS